MAIPTHTKVIVRTPDGYAFLCGSGMRAGKLPRKTIDVVEVAVGLILVLLLQFAIVEGIIVESGGWGRGVRCLRMNSGFSGGGRAKRTGKMRVN